MHRLIAALKKAIVISDFKSVSRKFAGQGIDPTRVETYLKLFRKLKDRNRIVNEQQRDVNFWGKGKFEDFVTFLNNISSQKSKTEEKKLVKTSGATLVAENDGWKVYRITTHEAAMKYGAGTKWCITEKDPTNWNDYIKYNNFYFLIAKDPKDNKYHKIALQVEAGSSYFIYWDAEDKKIDPDDVEGFHFPSFDIEVPETEATKIVNSLKEHGITKEISQSIENIFGTWPKQYIDSEKFLVLGKYPNLGSFAKEMGMSSLQFLLFNFKDEMGNLPFIMNNRGTTSIKDFLDTKFYKYFGSVFGMFEKEDAQKCSKFLSDVISKGLKNGSLITYISGEKPAVGIDIKDWPTFKQAFPESFYILADYVYENDADAKEIFQNAIKEATEIITREEREDFLQNEFTGAGSISRFLIFSKPAKVYDSEVFVGVHVEDLYELIGEDMHFFDYLYNRCHELASFDYAISAPSPRMVLKQLKEKIK